MNQVCHSVCAGMKKWHNAQCEFNRPMDEKSRKSEYGRFTVAMFGKEPAVAFETKIQGKTWHFIN